MCVFLLYSRVFLLYSRVFLLYSRVFLLYSLLMCVNTHNTQINLNQHKLGEA